jgi:hypothetical protein
MSDETGPASAVSQMSFEELRRWTQEVLAGEKPMAGGQRDDVPHGFLEDVYRRLDPGVRELFQDVLLLHLSDLARGSERHWRGTAADELLLLVGQVMRGSPRVGRAIDELIYIASQDRFGQRTVDLRWRALQTLVALRHAEPPEFWCEQYRIGGGAYAPVVVAGLALHGPDTVITWVTANSRDESVVNALLKTLPWLSETYGLSAVSKSLVDLLPSLRESDRSELMRVGESIGLDIQMDPESVLFSRLGLAELRVLAELLGLDLPAWPRTAGAWRRLIEEQLRTIARSEQVLRVPTADGEVLVGLWCALLEGGTGLPFALRDELCGHGEAVLAGTKSEEDANLLVSIFHYLRSFRRDLERELRELANDHSQGGAEQGY